MDVVSPDLVLNPTLLSDSGWAWTPVREGQAGGRHTQMVAYSKDSRVINLADYGSVVSCRSVNAVFDPERAAALHDQIKSRWDAIPLDQAPTMSALREVMARNIPAGMTPEQVYAALLITEGYMLAVDLAQFDADAAGVRTIPSVFTVVTVTVTPIAPSFRLSSQTD
jgi:hypothetical protein